MKKMWTILPIAVALSACNSEVTIPSISIDDEKKAYTLLLTGQVLANGGVENHVDIYAGSTKLGKGTTDADGRYSLTLDIDEDVYNKVKKEKLRFIASLENLQLVKLTTAKLSQAVEDNEALNTTVSSFSTADYILADLNNDGTVSHKEWQAYQSSQSTVQIGQNLIKYATVIKSAIDNRVTINTPNSLEWITELKKPSKWNDWYTQHQQALEQAWQASIDDPLLQAEAESYLVRSTKKLEEYASTDILTESTDTSLCQLNINFDDHTIDASQGEVSHEWALTALISDSLTGSLIDAQPSWQSSKPSVATVSSSGEIELLKVGTTEINADYTLGTSTCSANPISITVQDKQPEPVTLASISIGELPESITVNETVQLELTGTWSDLSAHVITDTLSWIATPNNAVSFDGNTLTALTAGEVTITASYEGKSSSKTFTIQESITLPPIILPPTLTDIRIDGYTESKPVGESWQLEAVGLYDDNSKSSEDITWASDNISVATVDTSGLVTAEGEGSAIITATKDDISKLITVEVTAELAQQIRIVGNITDLNKGEEITLSDQLTVFADYTKQDDVNITRDVSWSWSSSDGGSVSIANGNLRTVEQGTVTLTATWNELNSKELSTSLNIEVLPPVLVSMTPDILSGTLTMKEGETYNQGLKLTFSDGEIKDYSDQIRFSISNSKDKSNLSIAMRYDDNSIRALRAGNAILYIQKMPNDLKQYLNNAGFPFGLGIPKVRFVVEDNPDVYQWHLSLASAPAGKSVSNIQNVIYKDKVYRFWNVSNMGILDGIYLSTFDGTTHSDPQKIVDGRRMRKNEMVDGGGHGFTLLITEASNGYKEYFIYNLLDNTKHKIDFSGVTFDDISLGSSGEVYGFTRDGNLIVLDEANGKPTIYTYSKTAGQPETWEWTLGDTVKGTFIQLPSYSEHLVVLERTSLTTRPNPSPKYHFINRTTRVVETIELTYPVSAQDSNSYCSRIIIVPGSSINNFGAFCVVNTPGSNYSGYWLWSNNNLPPQVYNEKLDETVLDIYPSVAVKGGDNQTIAITGYIRDGANNTWLQFNETTPENSELIDVTRLPLKEVSRNTAAREIELASTLAETNQRLLENPDANYELVLLTKYGIAIKHAGSQTWQSDEDMYQLPMSATDSEDLFKLNGTWHIFSHSSSNYETSAVWSFQMRSPDPLLAQ